MTPDSERRNSTAMYNPITLAELKETYSGFDWSTYFTSVFKNTEVEIGDDERFIMVQPSYFVAAGQVEESYETVGRNSNFT